MRTHALSRWPRAATALAAALLLVTVAAAPARAHSQLISMSPADGSTVTVAPLRVVLTFDEDVQHIGDAVVVTAPDGSRVDAGPPAIQGPTVSEPLKALTVRGHYTVAYRVVSDDGHPVTRTLGFDLAAGTAPTATPRTGTDDGSGSDGVSWPVYVLVALLVGGAGWLFLPARRRPS